MAHHLLRLELAQAARAAGWMAELEVSGPDGRWRADVLASTAYSRRVALEAQLASITAAEIRARTQRMGADGVRAYWFSDRSRIPWLGAVSSARLARQGEDLVAVEPIARFTGAYWDPEPSIPLSKFVGRVLTSRFVSHAPRAPQRQVVRPVTRLWAHPKCVLAEAKKLRDEEKQQRAAQEEQARAERRGYARQEAALAERTARSDPERDHAGLRSATGVVAGVAAASATAGGGLVYAGMKLRSHLDDRKAEHDEAPAGAAEQTAASADVVEVEETAVTETPRLRAVRALGEAPARLQIRMTFRASPFPRVRRTPRRRPARSTLHDAAGPGPTWFDSPRHGVRLHDTDAQLRLELTTGRGRRRPGPARRRTPTPGPVPMSTAPAAATGSTAPEPVFTGPSPEPASPATGDRRPITGHPEVGRVAGRDRRIGRLPSLVLGGAR
ncbi:competence protein CoiA family protein [Streptomyces griseoluteus]|uniref:competence protein CoiA family protein n=1 Tax=Streptomyces griseoluteus TaxID=29306 RepID=UPI0036F93E8D